MIQQSFEDCPNHCNNGYVIDPYTHNKKKCEYCEEKRLALLNKVDDTFDIDTELNIPYSTVGNTKFEPDSIWTNKSISSYTDDSVEKCVEELKGIIEIVTLGESLSCSYIFNLGSISNSANFIGVFLRRAFRSGNTVAPFITTEDLITSIANLSWGIKNNDITLDKNDRNIINYNDLVTSKYLVMRISRYSEVQTLYYAFSLIKSRAEKGNATVVFTDTIRHEFFYNFDTKATPSFYNPKYVSIKMKDNKEEQEQSGIQIEKETPRKFDNSQGISRSAWDAFTGSKNGATF